MSGITLLKFVKTLLNGVKNQCIGILPDFYLLNMVFGSTTLHISTSVFLFIARVSFPASDSLIGVLRKRYGPELVGEVRTLEKIYFKHKKTILDLEFLISCRKIVLSQNLQFKVSNE